jgi:hypothetical protein
MVCHAYKLSFIPAVTIPTKKDRITTIFSYDHEITYCVSGLNHFFSAVLEQTVLPLPDLNEPRGSAAFPMLPEPTLLPRSC